MKTRHKIIEIGAHRYQIGKLLPDVGSFILMQMIGAGVKRDMETPASAGPAPDVSRETINSEDAVRTLAFGAFIQGLDFKAFQFIQNECLSVCCRMEAPLDHPEDSIPMPIRMKDGRWAIAEVRDDVNLVMRLTMEALVFNLADFFDQGGLRAVAPAEAAQAVSATASTGFSGGR